jgi:D-3-phosphoglycerate dehydrogenase / 2-oxoglutarate reductase
MIEAYIMKIVILSYAGGLKELLSSELDKLGFQADRVDYTKPLGPQLSYANVLVNGLGTVDKSIIDSCPNLKLVHQVGIGIDNVDVKYCTSKSIYVANVPHSNHVSVAEHTIFLMLFFSKNMKDAETSLQRRRIINIQGSELKDKNLLVIGLGATGMEVSRLAKCFRMNVIGVTKHPDKKRVTENLEFVNEIHGPDRLSEFLPTADYISIHTPLTDETKGMIGSKEFSLTKKSAYLINVARASLVDRNELFLALSQKRLAGAAFDVFWEEPANPDDRLFNLDNFVWTPHTAGWTKESSMLLTFHQLQVAVSRGQPPSTAINLVSR